MISISVLKLDKKSHPLKRTLLDISLLVSLARIVIKMISLWGVSRLVRNNSLFYRFSSTVTNNPQKEISFSDHRTAYAHLSRTEVLRAWFVLKLCSFDFLIQNSIKVSVTNYFSVSKIDYFQCILRYWNTVSEC